MGRSVPLSGRGAEERNPRLMTPASFKSIRERCNLTQQQLAAWLNLTDNGDRHIRGIESGERRPSGPVIYLMQVLDTAWTALHDPKHEYHDFVVRLCDQGRFPFNIGGKNG